MRPQKLTMQAFGSYGEKTTIDFTVPEQNLFLIAGDTGAGKSTIFDAIVFAIYGEASSGENKKDGKELQSQYAPSDIRPFVELTFTERNGTENDIYTVRRVPRHIRAKKRGGGEIEEGSTVSLILPDGSDYSNSIKETNRKLEEITGLTKDQFMQVAMIAQGEFMEFLRADTNVKKAILRRLFGTGIYDRLKWELDRERKEVALGMDSLKTAFQTEAAHARFEKDDEELSELQQAILSEDNLDITKAGSFVGKLKALNESLITREKEAGKACEMADALRDKKRDILQKAVLYSETLDQLDKEKESLPYLTTALKKAADDEEQMSLNRKTALETFTRTEEHVKAAEKNLRALDDAKAALMTAEKDQAMAAAREQKARQALENFDLQLDSWNKQIEDLSSVPQELEKCRHQLIKDRELETAADELEKSGQEREALKAASKRAADEYVLAREAADKAGEIYQKEHNIFLDEQAGLLAREKLRPGKPCPVCGSISHPRAARLSGEHCELTRERIDELAAQAEDRRRAQEESSAASAEAAARLKAAEASYEAAFSQFKISILEAGLSLPEPFSLKTAEELVLGRRAEHESAERELLLQSEKLQAIKQDLAGADGKKKGLKEKDEEALNILAEANSALSAARSGVDSLSAASEYPSMEEAEEVLRKAGTLRDEAEESAQKAGAALREARSALDTCRARIDQLNSQILSQRDKEDNPEKFYLDSRPDLESLAQELAAAEDERSAAQSVYDEIRGMLRADTEVLGNLEPKLEERGSMAMEKARLDSLYARLAGKVKGSRMDIESYVQRCYLRQILAAANIRFREMSAGQFELRLVDEEQAGTGGTNNALDLNVYSTVTGKVREVRTLSGGESFLAALSLALAWLTA